jgi:membrane-associated phospholipid phosphatase
MAEWGWVALAYSAAMLPAAALAKVGGSRRLACAAMAVVYAAVAWVTAPAQSLAVQLVVPGALLLVGYWMPGSVFGPPQPPLEAWLMRIDRQLFTRLALDERLRRAPAWLLEFLEACYVADYAVIGGGAIVAATGGAASVAAYWTVVLAAELTCYAALPWLRTRPPRALEPPGPFDERRLLMRRVNLAMLGRTSVQANTLPSGHVAGAVAAAFALAGTFPVVGAAFGALSLLIAVSVVVGRYHYVVDVVTGAIVALASALMLAS